MKKKVIIFGVTEMATFVSYYIEKYSNYEIDSYCVEKEYKNSDFYRGKKIITLDEISKLNNNDFVFFIAIGPTKMNNIRKRIFEEVKQLNFECINVVHPTVVCDGLIGENNFIGAYSVINPDVVIGSNNILYENCIISTRAIIDDHCYLAPKTYVGSDSIIKNNSILGINCTIKNGVVVEEKSLIGACCFISKSTKKESVYGSRESQFLGCISTKINISLI